MDRRGFLGLSMAAAAIGLAPSALAYGPSTLSAVRLGFSAQPIPTPGFGPGGVGGMLYVPEALDPRAPSAVVVLLHGYSPRNVGRRALSSWARDYGVLDAHDGLLGAPRFRGMVLVSPVTPVPYLDPRWSTTMERYVSWLATSLLPRVRQRLPEGGSAVFGLAGVSMGGYVGLEVLARRPDLFSSFTAIQAAIKPWDAFPVARRLRTAFQDRGAPRMQIITSDRDTYRTANVRLFEALGSVGVEAELEMDRGGHTRRWMQRVGSRAMLSWQDRVLAESVDSRTDTLIRATAERCPCPASEVPQS